MSTEFQDKAWQVLPKEFKEEVNEIYLNAVVRHPCGYNHKIDLLKYLFGYHNLTSNAEGEEMLTCEKSKAMQLYSRLLDLVENERMSEHYSGWCDLEREYIALFGENVFADYFGSKCLLDAHEDNFTSKDELNEDNFAKSEPKNEGTRQGQCVPKNAESGTHSFNHILKDDFHDHNRLHIAAMAMQGILSNADRMNVYEHVATTPPCEELTVVVARNALCYADELLRQSGKGASK